MAPLGPVQSQPSIAELEERVRRSPQDPDALFALAQARRADKPAESAKDLRAAIRLRPDFVEAYRLLAEIYGDKGYVDRQIETLEALLKRLPNDPNATDSLFRLYIDIRDDARANALTRATLAAHPNDHIAIEARIAYCYSAHLRDEGIALLKKLLAASPNDPDLLNRLAEMQRSNSLYADAEQSIRAALKIKPGEGLYLRKLANVLITSERPERLPEAEAVATQAVDARPGDEECLYWLAQALDLQHKTAEAIKYYERVALIDVRYEKTAFRLGRLYQEAGRMADADRYLKLYQEMEGNRVRLAQAASLLKNHTENVQNHQKFAQISALAGETGVAVAILRRAEQRFPNDAAVRRQLADTLRQAGRLTEAKAVLKGPERTPHSTP